MKFACGDSFVTSSVQALSYVSVSICADEFAPVVMNKRDKKRKTQRGRNAPRGNYPAPPDTEIAAGASIDCLPTAW